MCDTCACAMPARFHPTPTAPKPAPVAWRRAPEPEVRATRDDYAWNFAMDWYVMPPAATEPDAPATPADIAFDRLVKRVRGRLNRLRAGLPR